MAEFKIPSFPDDIKASAQRVWLAGLGALSMAEEEGGKLFRSLVDKGESFESRGKDHAAELRDRVENATRGARSRIEETRARLSEVGDDVKDRAEGTVDRVKSEVESLVSSVERKIDDAVSGALGRAGAPTRDEISVLATRIEELTRLVEQLKADKSKA